MTITIKTEVYCTLEIEGTHFWKECPFDEVAYLRENHRHMFNIKAFKIVDHEDRATEFIKLKHEIRLYLRSNYYKPGQGLHEFGGRSCEHIAHELIDEFGLSKCEVNEDSENGAVLTVEND